MTRRCRELLIAACALPALLAAGRAQTDRVPPAPGLFGPDEPLALTRTTNLKAVMKDRGSQSPYHAAVLAYNLLTERSLRVRLTRMTYVDSTGKEEPLTRHGFLLEDDRELAARNRAVLVQQKGLLQEDIDHETMGLVAVFQYMIGNTDWSVWGLHNIKLLEDSAGVMRPVPYDFDWSGVIAPPYARPDARLPIESVRQRLFRGACRSPEEFAAQFDKFQAKKDAIYALYRNEPALSPKRAEQSLRYYDDFYKTIGNPGRIKYEFLRACGNKT